MPDPAIHCTVERLVRPADLQPHPRNPNRHPDRQLAAYIKIISSQGWRRPIVVSRRSGCIVKGHGAREAALLAGWASVPVCYQEYPTDADELADLSADNEIARHSRYSQEKLADCLDDLRRRQLDPELAAFL